MTNFDPSAVAASVITDLTKSFLKSSVEAAKSRISNKLQKNFPHFEQHLQEVHHKVTQVKVLCSPDMPHDFKSIFVCPSLEHEDNITTEEDLLELVSGGSKVIVKSNGGTGKTFLLRHLWLSSFEKPKGRFPILIELRGLNDPTNLDLRTFIRATAFKAGNISNEVFEEFCSEGAFVFLFDGFDEVERENRAELEKQILALSEDFQDCAIVVTGRPDDRFASWTKFSTYRCVPFSYGQFRELINKVPFDKSSKTKFLKVASEVFFTQHMDFLSNPLLALMMLMTYRDNAEIPTKLSIFYENCFMALYSRHDAMKEQYNREKSLDQDEFRKVFSVFCFFSYLKSKPELEEAEIREFARKAIEFSEVEIVVDELLHEFQETVNLIQKDGTKFSFIHRSFQEYFAAYCSINVLSDKQPETFELFAERLLDSTFSLAYEMQPALVRKLYIMPKYEALTSAGIFPQERSKKKPYAALVGCGFSIKHRIVKGHSVSQSTSWGPAQDYYVLTNAMCRPLGLIRPDQKVSNIAFTLHKKFSDHCEKIESSSIPNGTEILFNISFAENQVEIQFEIDREYKRLPSVITSTTKLLENDVVETANELNEEYRKFNSEFVKEMELIHELSSMKSASLADEFGL